MLQFFGIVASGQRDFAQDHDIPDSILHNDPGWIERIQPGTLNIWVNLGLTLTHEGDRFDSRGIQCFDRFSNISSAHLHRPQTDSWKYTLPPMEPRIQDRRRTILA